MNLDKIASFKDSIPLENKSNHGDFCSSMLLKGVYEFLQGDIIEAHRFLMAISCFCDIKSPIEWECYEWSSFFLLYIDGVNPTGKDASFYVKKYKKRLLQHLYLRKNFYINFYSNNSIKEIKREIKGALKRRWEKDFLNCCVVSSNYARRDGDINTEWVEIVSYLVESIYLMYVIGNVKPQEVEIIKVKAEEIINKNHGKCKLAPFVDFIL